jgi:hypothetical protein
LKPSWRKAKGDDNASVLKKTNGIIPFARATKTSLQTTASFQTSKHVTPSANLTVAERLVRVIKARFSIAVALWVIIMGPILQTISGILQLLYDDAVSGVPLTLSGITKFGTLWIPKSWTAPTIGFTFLWVLGLAFPFYAIKIMREKVSATVNADEGYFRNYSKLRPQLALIGVFTMTDILVEVYSNSLFFVPNILIANLTLSPLTNAVDVSLYWAYFVSMKGFLGLGKKKHVIKAHYQDDSFLGLRPVGSTLLLVMVLFSGFAVPQLFGSSFILATFSNRLTLFTIYPIIASFARMVFGVGMFILPLWSFHRKITSYTDHEKQKLEMKISKMIRGRSESNRFIKLQYLKGRLSSVHNWMFDLRNLLTLLRLSASVALALLPLLLSFIGIHLG